MGFFKNLFDDISELGSKRERFKSKFTQLSKLLATYSFQDQMSPLAIIMKQKIVIAYNEMIVEGQALKGSETIRIYFRDEVKVITVNTALRVAEEWMEDVVDLGVKFTAAYSKRSISDAEFWED